MFGISRDKEETLNSVYVTKYETAKKVFVELARSTL